MLKKTYFLNIISTYYCPVAPGILFSVQKYEYSHKGTSDEYPQVFMDKLVKNISYFCMKMLFWYLLQASHRSATNEYP